jgi:hypothetical protein
MGTFEKEIKFLSKTLKQGEDGKTEWVEETKTVNATFKELDRTDRSQRALCWYVLGMFKNKQEEIKNNTLKLNEEALSEITDKYIEEMMIAETPEAKSDKTEFLKDNIGVVQFGVYLIYDKVLPFFLKLIVA